MSIMVRKHIEQFWPDRIQEEFRWRLGPVEDLIPEFRVRRVAPSVPSDPWLYLTVVVSSVGTEGLEFVLMSPVESPRHVETLAMVASFIADPRSSVSLGQTLNVGRPWIEGSDADHLLVSLPYPFGPSLEKCTVGQEVVTVLWLLPIHQEEARFAHERGVEALEQLFDAEGIDFLDPSRSSVS